MPGYCIQRDRLNIPDNRSHARATTYIRHWALNPPGVLESSLKPRAEPLANSHYGICVWPGRNRSISMHTLSQPQLFFAKDFAMTSLTRSAQIAVLLALGAGFSHATHGTTEGLRISLAGHNKCGR